MNRRLRWPLVFVCLIAACGGGSPVVYPVMPSALVPVDREHNKSRDFARVFCSTLPHLKDAGGRSWGDCARYLQVAEPPAPQPPLTTPYRFLFVSGLGGDCFNGVRAFSTSIAHLHEAHHVEVEYFAVPPFGSSSENGGSIAHQIDEGWAADATRRYVLIGYSKLQASRAGPA